MSQHVFIAMTKLTLVIRVVYVATLNMCIALYNIIYVFIEGGPLSKTDFPVIPCASHPHTHIRQTNTRLHVRQCMLVPQCG